MVPMPTPILVQPVNITVATPIPTIAPQLNPLLDIAPLNTPFLWLNMIPLWVYVGAILGLYFVWFNLKWWKKCGVLAPCSGYLDAVIAGSISAQQVIVFTKSRKWYIRMLTYHSEGMLYFKDLLQTDMWHMGASSSVGTLGGISAAITKDNFDEVVDPVADLGLCQVCNRFNHSDFGDEGNRRKALESMALISVSRPDGTDCSIREAIQEGLIPVTVSCFDDYIRLRPIMESIWPDGVKIPGYTMYDPYESDKFTPKQRSASLNGGVILQDSRDYAEDNIKENNWWDKNGVAMILILGGLIIMGISWIVTK
jgi:hypothetical protein